ncbi:hypothetical protein [Parashewanella tropica]|uniref:hypothetical protein n=1 Tax=Parashewanella tropica TaxID=2547970 RepID=UPI001478B512|nr:hypothetical protein [Parashewanella tropica]
MTLVAVIGGVTLSQISDHDVGNDTPATPLVSQQISQVQNVDFKAQHKLPVSLVKIHQLELEQFLHDTNNTQFIPTNSLRYLSLVQFSHDDIHPEYQLLSEVDLPPAPLLNKGYQALFNQQLDWLLTYQTQPTRLNGWKESNLIYRFIQQA